MRPDEHKKKKNTAYKKKHGISKDSDKDTKGKSDVSSNKNKKVAEKEKFHTKDNDDKRPGPEATLKNVSGGLRAAAVSDEESSSSDSQVEGKYVKTEKKTFQRRQIVSNWKKYEVGPDVEGDADKGGKDYLELLSMAGDAMSHFRFTDELEWDKEESNKTYPGAKDCDTTLSLNPAEIAESLACLPIHTILGLSQDLFPAEQLSTSIQKASENSAVYHKKKDDLADSQNLLQPKQNSLGQKDIFSGADDSLEDWSKLSNSTVVSQDTPLVSSLRLSKKVETAKSDLPTCTPDVCNKDSSVSQVQIDREESASKSDSTSENTADFIHFKEVPELDLDSLLELDSPSTETICASSESNHVKLSDLNSVKVPSDNKKFSEKEVTELDLDALLELETPNGGSGTKLTCEGGEKVQHKGTNAKSKPESAQLEDWLDSILDD